MNDYNLAKSVKRLSIDPKKAPRKISKREEKNKIDNNFFLLKSKTSLMNDKERVSKEVLKSKLLEPLIDERVNDKKGKESVKKRLNIQPDAVINVQKINIVDNGSTNIIPIGEGEKIRSKAKFGREKKFSPNQKDSDGKFEDFEEEEAIGTKEKKIARTSKSKLGNGNSSKTKSSLLSQIGEPSSNNLLINKLLQSQSVGQLHSDSHSNNFHMHLRSNNENRNMGGVSEIYSKTKKKVTTAKTSKRKAEKLTQSDDERLNIGSRKKTFR